MKKFVLKVEFHDNRERQRKVLKIVSSLPGIDEVAMDLKGNKLTVIGSVDPVSVVSKLSKKDLKVEFISCGPKEEPKKQEPIKEEPKKEESKKEESKKEESKKEEGKKEPKEEAKKEEKKMEPEIMLQMASQYQPYYPPPMQRPYYPPMYRPYYPPINQSIEENPNACVIC